MFLGEFIIGMGAQKLIDSTGGTGEFRVIVIVHDDNSPLREAREDKSQASLYRAIEVTVEEGKGDFCRQVLLLEVVKPGLFHDDGANRRARVRLSIEVVGSFEAMFAQFFDNFVFRNKKFTFLEVLASARVVFGSFLRQSGKRVVDPQVFAQSFRQIWVGFPQVFHRLSGSFARVFHRISTVLEHFAEQNRGVATIAAKFDKIARYRETGLGETENFGSFGRGDLVVDLLAYVHR